MLTTDLFCVFKARETGLCFLYPYEHNGLMAWPTLQVRSGVHVVSRMDK